MISHYWILGIPESASDDEIRAAYKKKAVQYHPDKHKGDSEMEEKFKEINTAYQVLSNPYEKARYDLQLKFGGFVPDDSYYHPPPPPRDPNKKYKKYNYAPREIDWKENARATAYAFAFTFVIAIIVMTAIGLKGLYDQKKLEALLDERREVYDAALSKHAEGNLDATLRLLNDLGTFMEPERDMAEFKKDLILDIERQSVEYFENSDYENAIAYIELLDTHTEIKALSIKENLAISYLKLNQPEKSVKVFMQLLILGYRNLSTYVQLAVIHRDELNDYPMALRYFQRANEVAKQYYQSIWGDAYVVTLTGNQLSEIHWELYTGLAEMYLETGQPEKAIDATRWNIRVWSNRPENYLIAAEGNRQLGNMDDACYNFTMARLYDPEVPVYDFCL